MSSYVIASETDPVSLSADTTEMARVTRIDVELAPDVKAELLIDPHHNLEERILREQFRV